MTTLPSASITSMEPRYFALAARSKKYLPAHVRRQGHHIRFLKPVDHGLQRQLVKFEICVSISRCAMTAISRKSVAGMLERILATLIQDHTAQAHHDNCNKKTPHEATATDVDSPRLMRLTIPTQLDCSAFVIVVAVLPA